jgi:hypothetical protein
MKNKNKESNLLRATTGRPYIPQENQLPYESPVFPFLFYKSSIESTVVASIARPILSIFRKMQKKSAPVKVQYEWG